MLKASIVSLGDTALRLSLGDDAGETRTPGSMLYYRRPNTVQATDGGKELGGNLNARRARLRITGTGIL